MVFIWAICRRYNVPIEIVIYQFKINHLRKRVINKKIRMMELLVEIIHICRCNFHCWGEGPMQNRKRNLVVLTHNKLQEGVCYLLRSICFWA